MSINRPDVTVVVPVFAADHRLVDQVEALRGQTYRGHIELIIADNGGHPGGSVSLLLRQFSTDDTFQLRIVDATAMRGASYARNVGWRGALADVILFSDADDVVSSDWVTGMCFAAEESSIFGGDVDERYLDPLSPPAIVPAVQLPRDLAFRPWTTSANLGARRSVLETVGGWNEAMNAGEDIDICWRAFDAGYQTTYAPESLVFYRPRSNSPKAFRQGFSWGLAAGHLAVTFRGCGFRPRSVRAALSDWIRLTRTAPSAMPNAWARREWSRLCGLLVGRLCGGRHVRIGRWLQIHRAQQW